MTSISSLGTHAAPRERIEIAEMVTTIDDTAVGDTARADAAPVALDGAGVMHTGSVQDRVAVIVGGQITDGKLSEAQGDKLRHLLDPETSLVAKDGGEAALPETRAVATTNLSDQLDTLSKMLDKLRASLMGDTGSGAPGGTPGMVFDRLA